MILDYCRHKYMFILVWETLGGGFVMLHVCSYTYLVIVVWKKLGGGSVILTYVQIYSYSSVRDILRWK